MATLFELAAFCTEAKLAEAVLQLAEKDYSGVVALTAQVRNQSKCGFCLKWSVGAQREISGTIALTAQVSRTARFQLAFNCQVGPRRRCCWQTWTCPSALHYFILQESSSFAHFKGY